MSASSLARRFALDVGWVSAYEVGEALRTRLFQLVLLAYTGGVAASVWIFVEILRKMEEPVAKALGVPATTRPGAMVNRLVADGSLDEMLAGVTGEDSIAHLLSEPVLSLWVGATAMMLLPLVVLASSAPSLAGEVQSRSIRYLSCRTGRLEIGLGKLAGQLLLGAVAACFGVVAAYGMGLVLMVGNPPGLLLGALAHRTLLACVYALPFAGLGLAASSWVRSPNGARVLALVIFGAMAWIAHRLAEMVGTDATGRIADLALLFWAPGVWSELWSSDPGVVLGAGARCVVLAVLYYTAGHVVFARRDL